MPELKIVSGPYSLDFHDITAPGGVGEGEEDVLSVCDPSAITLHHHLVLILNEKQIILSISEGLNQMLTKYSL